MHSQTASLAIAGTALAALSAGARKVGQQISGRCVRCDLYHGLLDYIGILVYLNVWSICFCTSGLKGKLFLAPDLREDESAVICPLHSILCMHALQKNGPETALGATNCSDWWKIFHRLFLCFCLIL